MKPIDRATLALEGLSIGDAFGQMFFGKEDVMMMMIALKALPAPPWYLTLQTQLPSRLWWHGPSDFAIALSR